MQSPGTPPPDPKPRRSALYVPGDKPRALEKARSLDADVLILDLEDAVAAEHKSAARANVRAALQEGFPAHEVLVRVNALRSPWGDNDLQMLLAVGPDGIVLPKAEDPREVRSVSLGVPLWLTIETPRGVLNVEKLAEQPGVRGVIMGTSDLTRDLRARHTPDRAPLLYALSKTVTVARAHGLAALDGVFLNIEDDDGFGRSCQQGRELGFDGKTVIHPRQVSLANRAFAPGEADVERARGVLSAWEAARAEGKSVTVYRGELVEELHVAEARALLRLHEIIAARSATR